MVNTDEVFVSVINIRIKKPSLEAQFQDKIKAKSRIYNPVISILNIFLVIGVFICYMTLIKDKNSTTSSVILANIVILFVFGILSLFLFIFTKTISSMVTAIGVINYYVFSMFLFTLRKIVFCLSAADNQKFVFFIDNTEMVLLVLWSLLELLDIEYIAILNIVIIIVMTTSNCFIEYWWKIGYINSILNYIIQISIVGISYYELKKSRYLFYCNHKINEQNKWYHSILQNINTGFIKVNNKKIEFMNTFIKDIFLKQGLIEQEIMNDITKVTNDVFLKIFSVLVNNLNSSENDSFVQEDKNNSGVSDRRLNFTDPLEILKNKIKEKNMKELFIYIGIGKLINTTDNRISLTYELYGRMCKKDEANNEDEFEFIIKDVTRIQITEEKNAEIKLKSVILSKIAHEFKNPLMCLREIIGVEKEGNGLELRNDYHQGSIQAIINYLLFLVKDIDLFSSIQSSSAIPLKISRFSYNDFYEFISMIGLYLIKKYHKNKRVSFKIIPYTNIPLEIETDIIKLKQILINLLTNSIKFTNEGSVILEISHEEGNYIKFLIRDTGIGISDEIQEEFQNLFSSTQKIQYSNCKSGTGLGIIIAKEISSILGKPLQLSSKVGKGSVFWFSVLNRSKEKFSNEKTDDSISTIQLNSVKLTISNYPEDIQQQQINIIIADDESLIRESTRRIIQKYTKKKGIKVNLIDAIDGVEILWLVFRNFFKKDKSEAINIIISDENMLFYSGQKSAKKLRKMQKNFKMNPIQFYLNSAYSYQKIFSINNCINGFLHKPLMMSDIELIFDNYFNINLKHKGTISNLL